MAVMTHDPLCFDYMGTTTRYCSCWRIAERIQREREAAAEAMRAACITAVEAVKSNEYESGRGLSDSDLILFERIFDALKRVQP